MQSHTTIRSWRAMSLASLFALGTCYVLFQDLLEGARLNTSHVLTLLALVGATAAGHTCLPTWREGRRTLSLGLAVVALGGLVYIVTMSGARNAETIAAKTDTVKGNNADRAKLTAEIADAKRDLKQQQAAAVTECNDGPGPRCKSKRSTADRTTSHLAILEVHLQSLKPAAVEHAGYKHVARLWITFIGGDARRVEDALVLGMPFLAVLLTELGTIVFLGMALGHEVRPRRRPANDTAPDAEPPPAKRRPGRSNVIEHPVLVALRQAGRPLSNDELAQAMGVTKGEASKRRREVEHRLTQRRDGRHLRVSVA